MKIRRGAKLLFTRFNGVRAEGAFKSTDNTGRRGPWHFVKVDWRSEPMKVRSAQILKVDGVAVA